MSKANKIKLIVFSLLLFSGILLNAQTAHAFFDVPFAIMGTQLDALDFIDSTLLRYMTFLAFLLVQGIVLILISANFLEWAITYPIGLGPDNLLVNKGWEITSHLTNMFFILIFVAIAIAYILKLETFGMKKALPKLIIMALLTNFSLLFTKMIVDIGWVTQNAFFNIFFGGNQAFATTALKPLTDNLSKILGFLTTDLAWFVGFALIPGLNVAKEAFLALWFFTMGGWGMISEAVVFTAFALSAGFIPIFTKLIKNRRPESLGGDGQAVRQAQNEEAWLNILKLQTTKYLASQLLHITDYWPEVGYKNKEFFGKLSRYFRSMDHHFGSMIAEKEREKQSEFNYFLLEYISSKPIPTVITLERYRDLISYAPRMAEALGDHLENYLTQSRFIETEQQFTLKELKKVFKNYPYSLLDRRSKELAQWIREKILEIKKQFFHSHLLYHFVQEREIDESKIPELEEKYLKQFSQELSLDLIQTWVINFHSPNSSLKASAKFLKLTLLDVPSMVELIQEIDDQIQALLLYDFNKSVSWSYDVLEGRPERAYMRGKGLADR